MHLLLTVALLLFPLHAEAQAPSFTDVPPDREEFLSVEDLKRRGILEGRPDGTFGPDQFVNRAEAVTIVVRAVANARNLPALQDCFPDVHASEWYVGPICYAADLEWISGYPDGTFQPVRTVAKGEFLKILLQAYGVDTGAVTAAWKVPLAVDAADTTQWYFPYLAYALTSSMTRADTFGNLNPGAALTRGQVALLVHRFLLYREKKQTQVLLTAAEEDIRLTFGKLEALEIPPAKYAAHRVRLLAWGAGQVLPETPVVQATGTLGEALSSLVRAYDLTGRGDFAGGLQTVQEAYRLADATDTLQGGLIVYTDRVRTAARELANAIRAHQQ